MVRKRSWSAIEDIFCVFTRAHFRYVCPLQIFSYWGPTAMLSLYPGYDSSDLDTYLGLTSLVAGVVGSIGGGLCLDWVGSSLRNAFR